MICPIKNLGHILNQNANRIYTTDCSKDCQIWDKDREDCGLKAPKEVKISGGINTHPY